MPFSLMQSMLVNLGSRPANAELLRGPTTEILLCVHRCMALRQRIWTP